jgi:elongation factor G
MEFARYAPLPQALAEELIKKHRDEQAKKAK